MYNYNNTQPQPPPPIPHSGSEINLSGQGRGRTDISTQTSITQPEGRPASVQMQAFSDKAEKNVRKFNPPTWGDKAKEMIAPYVLGAGVAVCAVLTLCTFPFGIAGIKILNEAEKTESTTKEDMTPWKVAGTILALPALGLVKCLVMRQEIGGSSVHKEYHKAIKRLSEKPLTVGEEAEYLKTELIQNPKYSKTENLHYLRRYLEFTKESPLPQYVIKEERTPAAIALRDITIKLLDDEIEKRTEPISSETVDSIKKMKVSNKGEAQTKINAIREQLKKIKKAQDYDGGEYTGLYPDYYSFLKRMYKEIEEQLKCIERKIQESPKKELSAELQKEINERFDSCIPILEAYMSTDIPEDKQKNQTVIESAIKIYERKIAAKRQVHELLLLHWSNDWRSEDSINRSEKRLAELKKRLE